MIILLHSCSPLTSSTSVFENPDKIEPIMLSVEIALTIYAPSCLTFPCSVDIVGLVGEIKQWKSLMSSTTKNNGMSSINTMSIKLTNFTLLLKAQRLLPTRWASFVNCMDFVLIWRQNNFS